MSLVLIDATSDSLTVSWQERNDARQYVLQFRKESQEDFVTLTDQLTTPQARKRNLEPGVGYFFRGGVIVTEGSEPNHWATNLEPFHVFSAEEQQQRMEAPSVTSAGNHAGIVAWKRADQASTYELQMRENVGGADWITIAPCVAGTEVRKKNLNSLRGCQFRVRPTTAGNKPFPFSLASQVFAGLGLTDAIKRLFGSLKKNSLLRKGNKEITLADALGGKEFVLLYASAHWCGPCRQFTPKLTQWYESLSTADRNAIEVVFLSADHDAASFKSYFATMPWLAVDVEDRTREELMGHIKVSGIPRLAVLDGKTGRIVQDNAVGQGLIVNQWRVLAGK